MKQLKKVLTLVTLLVMVFCLGLNAEAASKSKKSLKAGATFTVKSYKKAAKTSNGNVAYVTKKSKNKYIVTANNPGTCKITYYKKGGKKKVTTVTVKPRSKENVAAGGSFTVTSYKKPKVSANLAVSKVGKNTYRITAKGEGTVTTYDKNGKKTKTTVNVTRGTGYKERIYRKTRITTIGDSFSIVSYTQPTATSAAIVITKTGENTYTIKANGDGTLTTTDLNGDVNQTVIVTTKDVNERLKSFQPAETATGTPHKEVTYTATKTVLQGDSYTFTSSKTPVTTGALTVELVQKGTTGLDLYKVTVNGDGTLKQWNLNGDPTITTIKMTTIKKVPTKSVMTNERDPSQKYVDKIEIAYKGTTPIENAHEFKNSEFLVREFYADGTEIPTDQFRPWQLDVIGDTNAKTFTINAWIIQSPRIKTTIVLPMVITTREVSETTVTQGESCYYKWDVKDVTLEVNTELAVPAQSLMNCHVQYRVKDGQIISCSEEGVIKGIHAGTTNLTAYFYRNSDNALIGTLQKTVYVTAKRTGISAECLKDSVELYYTFTGEDFKVVFNHADGSTSLCNKYIMKYVADMDAKVYHVTIISTDEKSSEQFNTTVDVPFTEVPDTFDSITANSKILEVTNGTTLSPADFNVYAVYASGKNRLLDPSEYSLSDPVIEAGYAKVTITYKADPTKTYDIEIKVKGGAAGTERVQVGLIVTTSLDKVLSGYQFKNSDFTVKAKYSNGSSAEIGNFEISDVQQNSVKNTYKVTIKDGEFTQSIEIPYQDLNSPEGKIQVAITIKAKKTSYKDGDKPTSKDDFIVENVYSDGSKEVTTDFEFKQSSEGYPYEAIRKILDKHGDVIGEVWEVTATQGNLTASCYVEIIYPYITGISAEFKAGSVTLEFTDTNNDGVADAIIDHAFTKDEFLVLDQYSDGTTVEEKNFSFKDSVVDGAPVYNEVVGQYEVVIKDNAHGFTKTVRIPATNAADAYDVIHPKDTTPKLNGVDFIATRTEIYTGEDIADYITVILHYSDGVTITNAGVCLGPDGTPYVDSKGLHPYDPSKFSCTFKPQTKSGLYHYTVSYDRFTSRDMVVTVLDPAKIIQSVHSSYEDPYIISGVGFVRNKINITLKFLDGHTERYTDFNYTGEGNAANQYYPDGGAQATTIVTLNNLDQFENVPKYDAGEIQVSAPSREGQEVKAYKLTFGGNGYSAGGGADLQLPESVPLTSVKNKVIHLQILTYEDALKTGDSAYIDVPANACEIDCPDYDPDAPGLHKWTLSYPKSSATLEVEFTVNVVADNYVPSPQPGGGAAAPAETYEDPQPEQTEAAPEIIEEVPETQAAEQPAEPETQQVTEAPTEPATEDSTPIVENSTESYPDPEVSTEVEGY